MKALATAFVELVGYIEIAKFDDSDEAQGAEETISRCMINATEEERAAIAGVARELAREAERQGAIELAKRYHSISHWTRRPMI